MLPLYRNKVCASQRHSGTERIRLSTVPTPALHPTCIHATRRHTNTRAVSREHSPDTAAQTNTLKIQTTHIQTLSLLNELALLRKDSATTLYHTLIPWGELAIGRDEQKKRGTLGYERGREKEEVRGEIKKRLERGRRAGRGKCCTSLLISLRKMIEGIGWGGRGAGVEGGCLGGGRGGGGAGGGGVVCCRSRQTSGWVNRLMGVRGGEGRWGDGGGGGRVQRCCCAGGNSAVRAPSRDPGPICWWDWRIRLVYTRIAHPSYPSTLPPPSLALLPSLSHQHFPPLSSNIPNNPPSPSSYPLSPTPVLPSPAGP